MLLSRPPADQTQRSSRAAPSRWAALMGRPSAATAVVAAGCAMGSGRAAPWRWALMRHSGLVAAFVVGLRSLVFLILCSERRLVLSWVSPGMGRDEVGKAVWCERVVHLGAGRNEYWAASPLSYLAAPPAHPGEPRARIGKCRMAQFRGAGRCRPRRSSPASGPPERTARWGFRAGLTQLAPQR